MSHRPRRAAEMQKVAATVDELGREGRMSRATAAWQEETAPSG